MKKGLISVILFCTFSISVVFSGVVPFFPHLVQQERIALLLNDPDYEIKMAFIEEALINLDVNYRLYKTYNGEFPESGSYDGLLVSGGADMREFIDPAGNVKKGGEIILQSNVPVMGICMGAQVIGRLYGSKLSYQPAHQWSWVRKVNYDPILTNIPYKFQVWENHDYGMPTIPDGFILLVEGLDGSIQLIRHQELPLYAIQFHPAATLADKETVSMNIVRNFLEICGAKPHLVTTYPREDNTEIANKIELDSPVQP